MRLTKGTKVEVFCQKEDPSGCWRCGEIVSGNDHTYTVRYDAGIGSLGGQVIDRVPCKAIRPCPPVIKLGDVWVSGDVVEVFHSFAWRVATVVQVVSDSQYLVRLYASSHELEVNEDLIRRRLRLQDDKWVAFPKRSYEDLKRSGTGSRCIKDKFFALGNIGYTQDSQSVLSRNLKRRYPFQYPEMESQARPYQKVRADEKDSVHIGVKFTRRSPLPESKVDAVVYLRKREGETCINSSFYDRLNGCSEMMLQREEPNGAVGGSHAMNLEPGDDSFASSVGSCDILVNPSSESPNDFSRSPFEDSDGDSSDAESSNQSGYMEENSFLHREEMSREVIHGLELDAYRGLRGSLCPASNCKRDSWDTSLLWCRIRSCIGFKCTAGLCLVFMVFD
ncbi:hypothetical protein Droror1_Dr00023802 [Drosera rotundifolia]